MKMGTQAGLAVTGATLAILAGFLTLRAFAPDPLARAVRLSSPDDFWLFHQTVAAGGTFRVETPPIRVPHGLTAAFAELGDVEAPYRWHAPLTDAEATKLVSQVDLGLRSSRAECEKLLASQTRLTPELVLRVVRIERRIARDQLQKSMLLAGDVWVMHQTDWNRLDGLLQYLMRDFSRRCTFVERFVIRSGETLKVIVPMDRSQHPEIFGPLQFESDLSDQAIAQALATFSARPRHERVQAWEQRRELASRFRQTQGLERIQIWQAVEKIVPPGTRLSGETFELRAR